MAWSGSWGAMWEEANSCLRKGAPAQLSAAQRLAREVKSVEEALADEDMREALRRVDAKLSIASDGKARRCLPALFPQAALQPTIPMQDPREEEVGKFRLELRRAYSYTPSHRAAGPGDGRNEHWSWMPQNKEAWQHVESLLLGFSLGKLP